MARKGRVDDPKVYLRKLWADDPEFFVLYLRADAFELADGDGAS